MILAYHGIFTTYGTWLPNDPRGSFSTEMYNAELQALGAIQYGRQAVQPARPTLRKFWTAAAPRLSRPPFFLNEQSRPSAAEAFGDVVARLSLQVPACAIMNDHMHILIMRSKYTIEYLVNQLKGSATAKLGLTQTPWARGRWKVFIDNDDALQAAIAYVQANPVHAGLPAQRWDFVMRGDEGRTEEGRRAGDR